MTNVNDTYIGELNQIRERQTAVLDEIERIRADYHNQIPAELEDIRNNALDILKQIDEIKDRRETEVFGRPLIIRQAVRSSDSLFICR